MDKRKALIRKAFIPERFFLLDHETRSADNYRNELITVKLSFRKAFIPERFFYYITKLALPITMGMSVYGKAVIPDSFSIQQKTLERIIPLSI